MRVSWEDQSATYAPNFLYMLAGNALRRVQSVAWYAGIDGLDAIGVRKRILIHTIETQRCRE